MSMYDFHAIWLCQTEMAQEILTDGSQGPTYIVYHLDFCPCSAAQLVWSQS